MGEGGKGVRVFKGSNRSMGFMTNFKEPSLYIVELNEQLLTSHHRFFHQFVKFLAIFVSKLITQTD